MPLRRAFLASLIFAVVVILFWTLGGSQNESSSSAQIANSHQAKAVQKVQSATAARVPANSATPSITLPPENPQAADREKVLEEFTSWTERYMAANPNQREALEQEGVKLATARRPWFQKLIQTDPRTALERAVPRVVRQDLPEKVVAKLEKPVSSKGDYNVYLGRPALGVPVPPEGLTLRYFEADGVSYKAHVFGELSEVMSKKGVPLRGISIDRDMAVAENAVRRLEIGERIPGGTLVEETCPVSGLTTEAVSEGQTVTEVSPTVEIGSRIITLCNGAHVSVLEDDFRTYIQSSGPGGGGFFMDNFPGTSSRAIGNLRCLYIRVTYPDQMAQPNTEEQAYADMRDNARFYLENSYGKLTQTTTVTPVLTLPRTVAWYKAKDAEVDGLGLVHNDSRAAARSAGYDPSQYDCIIVRVNQGPRLEGISWGGGTSVWITWNGMDVLNHEIGHSLGRNHANSWDSLDGTPYGFGQNGEYGNPFDVMGGSGGFSAHYNIISKRALAWLPNSYMHLASDNGVYRIFAYDQPTLEEGKRYGLNVAKDSVRQYNIEYHPARGGFLANNALVLYSGMGSNAGHLLDTTQGSLNGKGDGGIAVGRTFSDHEGDMHFTVLSQNNTSPPSLDIAYNRGPFPANTAPTATLAASATTIAVGGSVTFTATASDAEGDALAYHWLFDDGVSGTNSAEFTRTFTAAAQVNAMLTVSDMKGGVVRRSIVINVGSHGRQTISGSITVDGLPLQGVYVSGGGKASYTNADGSYSLAGISTGAQTLTAALAGYTFTPGFTNPLTVVAGTNTANWTAASATFVTLAKIADANEGGANGTFRLTRTGNTDASLTVLVSPVGGTAVKGTDYTFTPDFVTSGSFRAFTIPVGAGSLDISVAAVNSSGVQDTTAEGPETITMQLAGATGYFAQTASAVVMTVVDNDTTLPQVRVTAPDPYAMEAPSGDAGSFLFTRVGSTDADLNLSIAWTGAASNGTDHSTLPTTVAIPAGQSSLTLPVTSIDDALIETPEDVIATINTSAAYIRDTSATTATVTISDDDTPFVSVSVPDSSAAEGSANGGLFLLTRTGSTAAALKVYYGLSGSAMHGTDYAALNGEVTIPAGATSAPVVISPYDDDVAEPVESVTLAIANFNNGYNIGSVFQGTVNITDNGDTPLVNVRSGNVGTEGGTNPTFVFRSIGNGTGNITVNYTVSGTATSGSDYTALSGSVSVPANGSNDTTVTIPLINDTLPEPTETVVVTITPSANYRAYNDATAEMVIQDNDSGADRVSVSIYNHSPGEATPTSGTFYFSRTLTAGDLTVNYAISGTATNGSDYATLSGSVVIPDTQSGVNLVMTPINDTLAEGTETVTLTVLPGTGYGADRPASATFEITDNESPAITVGFQQSSLVTSEQPGALGEYRDIPVVLSAASSNTITVRYHSAGGSASGDDVDWAFVDAANGNRPILSGMLTFLPGMTTQNLRIRVKNDAVMESGELALLQLFSPFNATLTSGRSQNSVTIFDDATPVLVTEERWNTGTVYTNNTWNTVTPSSTSFLTGFTSPQDVADNFSRRITGQITAPTSGVYNFWIASDDSSRLFLSTTANAANKVQIATLSGWTGFQNWDANASQKSANITLVAGQSYYMEVQHQEGGGGDHVSVAWQGPGFARTPITSPVADTAPRTVRLATSNTTRLETDGTEPLLQVILDRPAGSTPITVDYSTSGTATAGSDYTLTPGTLTFAAGEQTKAIPLSLITDAVNELPESIIVAISNPVGASLSNPSAHTIALIDPGLPVVDTLFITAASSQAANTVLTTATATEQPGRTITGWSIVSGNASSIFAINASGQLRLVLPASLPNPGGVQLIVRATDDLGASGDGVINVICNPGAQAVVEQRWSGTTAFWNESWTGTPTFTGTRTMLTSAQGVGDNYSRRLTSYLKPQTTGDYTFWIAGDDDCRLYLSTDGYQANKVLIASVNGWTNYQSWDQSSAQKSATIPLVAGKVYWIEAQQQEGGGGDHVSVAWSGPGISRVAIPATVMVSTAPGINFTAPGTSLPNTAPTISNVTDLEISEDSATSAITFTVGDAETSASALPVSISSSNQALVSNAAVVLAGSGASRTVTITPMSNQFGSATITLTVSDGMLTASDTFIVTVTSSNDLPSITTLSDQTIPLNSSTSSQLFSVDDLETPVTALTITRGSSNLALVPLSSINISGTGIYRTVTVTPATDKVGSAIITLGAQDSGTTTSTSFVVTVTGTPSQTWWQQNFGSISLTGDFADTADMDLDGIPNLLEYALGLSPNSSNPVSANLVLDTVPQASDRHLRFTITKNPLATDLTYVVEITSDLTNPAAWTTSGIVIESSTSTTLFVRDSNPMSSGAPRFMRLRVTRP